MEKVFFILMLFIASSIGYAQENDILERLFALKNNGKIWLNVDNYTITSEDFDYPFDEKGLKKAFKKNKIKESSTKTKNATLLTDNFCISETKKIADELYQSNHYYFIKNREGKIKLVWFAKAGSTDQNMEETLVNMLFEDKIPQEKFLPINPTRLNILDKEIMLGTKCYWTMINTIQCPYNGEMNWALHKTLQGAKESVENQLKLSKSRSDGKIQSEETVMITFLGVPVQAKKVIVSLQGINALLVGNKAQLIIYYVAENINGKNISCVMSFWNDDVLNPKTKLPALIEQLIEIQ